MGFKLKTVTFGRQLLNKVSQLQITNSYGKKKVTGLYGRVEFISDDESDSDFIKIMRLSLTN